MGDNPVCKTHGKMIKTALSEFMGDNSACKPRGKIIKTALCEFMGDNPACKKHGKIIKKYRSVDSWDIVPRVNNMVI